MRRLAFSLALAAPLAAAQPDPTPPETADPDPTARVLVAQAYDQVLDGRARRFAFAVETRTPDTTLVDTGRALTVLDPETAGPRFRITFDDGETGVSVLRDDAYLTTSPRTRTVYVDSARARASSGVQGLLLLHPAFGAALYSVASDARATAAGPDAVDGRPCARARYVVPLDEVGGELALDVCFDDATGLPSEIRYQDSDGVEARMTFRDLEPADVADSDFTVDAPEGWRVEPYDSRGLPTLEVGAPAPAFSLPGPGGQAVALADYRGRWVLVDFWGTWCAPCVQAIPRVSEIAAAYPELAVLALASYEDPDADPAAFVRRRGGGYPVVEADEATVRGWRVRAFPTYVVVDPRGRVAFVGVPDHDPGAADALDAFLADALAD